VEILDKIPFLINKDALMRQLMIEKDSEDEKEFDELIQLAIQCGRPKAVFLQAFIDEKTNDGVVINGITFTSKTLRHNLSDVQRIFPFVITCGTEMDDHFPPGSDILKDFWWDALKMQLLNAARLTLRKHLSERFRLGKTASMSPGSGDVGIWHIEQQRQLFALLGDVKNAIGVELTDTCLMVPNKTGSGILYPAQIDFQGCEVCHRENCPSRRAAFNASLWEEIQPGSR
jgi:hypothetical protein